MIQELQIEVHAPVSKPAKKGSPWSSLNRKLTNLEYSDLCSWKKSNPSLKYKMGDIREDGKVFRQYSPCCNGGELWGTMNRVRQLREYARLRAENKRGPNFNKLRNEKRRKQYAERDDLRKYNADNHRKWRERIGPNELSRIRRKIMKRANKKPKMIALKMEWLIKNKPRLLPSFAEASARRRAIKKYSSDSSSADRQKMKGIYCRANSEGLIHGIQFCVDHIIPLVAGGFHHQDNLQPMPFILNSNKHDDPFWVSSVYLDWRDVPENLWPAQLVQHYKTLIRYLGHPLKSTD